MLWHANGIPWPSSVNSLSDLADRLGQPLTDPLALDLLSLAGWACWAAFAMSFIRESWWYATHLPHLVRDRAAHHEHLAKVSFKGSVAALCVGTLVVALMTVWRPQAAMARQHTAAEHMGTQAALSAPYHPGSPAPVRLTDDDRTDRSGQEEARTDQKYIEYTVAEGDCLWDVAHKHLGDSVKWPRIFAANRDRLQPDGQRLTDPNRLQPGWLLRIPTPTADSSSSGEASPPSKATPPATSVPGPDAEPQAHKPTLDEDHRQHEKADEHQRVDVRPAPHGSAAISVGEAGVIGITTAAGLLAALRLYRLHQRRRALSDPEVAHEGAEQPENLATVVQQATQAAREADLARTPPGTDDLLTRRTPPGTGDLLTRRTPPPPPQANHVVALGTRDDVEVTLEELAAARLCTWTGPGAEPALRALLISILTAAERQRPQPPRVTAALPRNLAVRLLPTLPPDVRALIQAADLDDVIQAGQEHLLAHARRNNGLDPQQDHQGEHHPLADDSPTCQSHGPGTLLLITDQVSGQDAAELAALAEQASSGALGILTLDVPLSQAARWHIDHDGTATIAATSNAHARKSPLRIFRLTEDAGQEISTLLSGAQGRPPRQQSEAGREGTAKGPAERDGEDAAEEDDGDNGEAPADSSHTPDSGEAGQEQAEPVRSAPGEAAEQPGQTAPVRLQLLGPVTLFARGSDEPIASHLRMEAREFLALLASHPAGLLARDIADNLRLAGGAEQHAKELKNLRRSVRRTLRAATGLPHAEFIHLKGEFHRLNPGFIETDIANFRAKIRKLSTADGDGCIIAVRDILDDYRGPFCQGIDPVWADGIRESLARQAADAVIRAARQAERSNSRHDRQIVLDLLDRLISLHPDTEALYQHSIRLNQAAGRREAAHHAYQRLTRHLAELGLEPDAATRALITARPEASPPRTRAGTAGARSRPRATRISGRGDETPPEAPRLSRR
ncbi:BTAD domain-containing putative transcriptional regulator [Streptomyces sp. CA-250714]|uniref:BTAD domain-containing putative transcriptional regulator n=1 Tax=Streptomyces sp. CA-250714 TaxID=3240060 RepID=UPI003D8A2441